MSQQSDFEWLRGWNFNNITVMPTPAPVSAQSLIETPTPDPQDIVQQMIREAIEQRIEVVRAGQQEVQEIQEGHNMSEVIIVAGGVIVIIYYANRAIQAIYRYAVGRILEAEQQADGGGWRGTLWNWIGFGLQRMWIPLWFSSQRIQADVRRQHLQDQDPLINFQQPIIRLPSQRYKN